MPEALKETPAGAHDPRPGAPAGVVPERQLPLTVDSAEITRSYLKKVTSC